MSTIIKDVENLCTQIAWNNMEYFTERIGSSLKGNGKRNMYKEYRDKLI